MGTPPAEEDSKRPRAVSQGETLKPKWSVSAVKPQPAARYLLRNMHGRGAPRAGAGGHG